MTKGRNSAHIIFLFLLFVFLGLQSLGAAVTGQERAVSPSSITEDLSQGPTFRFKIALGLPEFTFKIIPEPQETDDLGNAHSTVRDVEVFRGDVKQPIQHLTGCDLTDMEAPPKGSHWFRAQDVNFDGYQDIFILTSWGATGNESGCVWLYNPATGRFDYSKDFSELDGYWLDPATKTITTYSRFGMAGRAYTAAKFKVRNNRPVLVWSETQDWDSNRNQFHCVAQQLRGNKMVTVRDEWGGTEDGDGPCDPAKVFEDTQKSPK